MASRCLAAAAAAIAVAAADFVHPGVLIGSQQLAFIKSLVDSKSEPVYSVYQQAVGSKYGDLNYQIQGPPKSGTIECGSYSKPDYGCSEEDDDASAAYTQILLYNLNGNKQYAANAVAILNSYGHNLKKYNNSNAPLQAAWGASKWMRAAELTLHTGDGAWASSDVLAFASMVQKVTLPLIENGSPSNGNWELSMIEGLIGASVFLNDTGRFNNAVKFWQKRVPAYIWTLADGPQPVPAPRGDPSWYGMTTFNASTDGVAQETCRDFGHTSYGIAASFNIAETALLQGIDLYGMSGGPARPGYNATFIHRLGAALEFHSKYLRGTPAPQYLCGGKPDIIQMPTMEVGYTSLAHRLGMDLPWTLQHLTQDVRHLSSNVDAHMMVWETLTHGGGCAGCQYNNNY